MKELRKSLKERQYIKDNQHQHLEHTFSRMAMHVFKNQIQNTKTSSQHGNQYCNEIKQFAMTLHYYSPPGYDFVRKIFALPHESSIRAWAASIDCEPRYLINLMKQIGSIVQKRKWMSDVVVMGFTSPSMGNGLSTGSMVM